MRLEGIIWLGDVLDKLAIKHHVTPEEAEEVLTGRPKFRFVEKKETEKAKMFIWPWEEPRQVGTWPYCSFSKPRKRL